MADIEKLADQLGDLTILEAAELTKLLEEKWGVSAAAPVAVAAVAGAPGAAGAADEAADKTEYDVILKDVGPKKIDVIKVIRQITQLGLKDAKDLTEASDSKIMEAAGKEAAQDAKSKLEAAGATVELV